MIKLALIGLGSMGKNYLSTIASFKNAQITHLCSKTQKTLDSYPDKYCKTTDYKSLIGNKQIDAIIITSPASTHFELASFFLKNRIPLLIEKPLTTNYDDALNLLKLQNNTPVLVGHTLIYHPVFMMIKQNLPKIGQLKKLTFIGANNNPISDTNLIYDWGPHPISLFLNLLKQNPFKIKLAGSKTNKIYGYMNLNYQLIFPDSIEAAINISWDSSQKKRQLIVEGTESSLKFDDFAKSKLTFNQKPLEYNPTPPLTLELKDFLKALKTNSKPQSDLKFGADVVKVLDMLNKSADSNLERS